ncbi:hypothetical protein Taro_003822 [Colocasia esculenta]|uniref:Uncharacterized protein n=1 Tax=Colocasia esculenta TaxID=4460 RepID=A0A843TPY8_COLES|nr:hypothetical protein [Colocasia esculenta]
MCLVCPRNFSDFSRVLEPPFQVICWLSVCVCADRILTARSLAANIMCWRHHIMPLTYRRLPHAVKFFRLQQIWLRVVGMVFQLVMASRGEMSLGVRIRVSSRPLHPRVLYFLHRHQ